jgi:hypothetical protein
MMSPFGFFVRNLLHVPVTFYCTANRICSHNGIWRDHSSNHWSCSRCCTNPHVECQTCKVTYLDRPDPRDCGWTYRGLIGGWRCTKTSCHPSA